LVVRYKVAFEEASGGADGFVPVAKASDVSEGAMVSSMVSGNPVLISRIGGNLYAMDAICSHFFGYLPKGELKSNVVICPVHKAQYDVQTGKVVKNVPGLMKMAGGGKVARDLRTYEIRVVGDNVLVKA